MKQCENCNWFEYYLEPYWEEDDLPDSEWPARCCIPMEKLPLSFRYGMAEAEKNSVEPEWENCPMWEEFSEDKW